MESTGEPDKTQISQESQELLCNEYPEFVVTKRGEIDVKVMNSLLLASEKHYSCLKKLPLKNLKNKKITFQFEHMVSGVCIFK